MKKTAIYWWAFNPPTLWHYNIIKEIIKKTDIEKVIIVPDGLRLDKSYQIDESDRINLIHIFIGDLISEWYNIEFDDYFLLWKNKSDTTTYEVDKYFIKKLGFPPHHIFWTDICYSIKDWTWNPNKYVQKRLKKIFVPRKWFIFNDYDLENYKLLNINYESNISSTNIRENVKKWVDISWLVSENIKEYIINNNLYK